jgi:hypothetical protein
MKYLPLLSLFASLLTGCTSEAGPAQVPAPTDWQAALTPLARAKISFLSDAHDTFGITWGDGHYEEISDRPVALPTLLAGFHTHPRVQPDSFADLACYRLRTPTSTLYWTPEDSTVIRAMLGNELVGALRHVYMGMEKGSFFKVFLTSYPAYLETINVVGFDSGYGTGDNGSISRLAIIT